MSEHPARSGARQQGNAIVPIVTVRVLGEPGRMTLGARQRSSRRPQAFPAQCSQPGRSPYQFSLCLETMVSRKPINKAGTTPAARTYH